jgi:signal peptidase II
MTSAIGMRLVLVIAIVATIGCDRVTKHFAATMLAGGSSRSFLADTVRLEYGENPGGFLSLGASLPAMARISVFVIGTGAALLCCIWVAVRSPVRGWTLLGLSFFVGGGASNWADRVTQGRVFNVADMAIMLGAGIVLLSGLWGHHSPTPLGPERDPTSGACRPL